MSSGFLMGLDLGGGGARCLLVDATGSTLHSVRRPWSSRPAPQVPMAMEYEPEPTWGAVAGVAREALAKAGIAPERILGIAATSMRHGSALLDAEGRELLLAPNRDARGSLVALQLAAARGEEIQRRTGRWPNPIQPGPRLRWFVEQAPETLARAATHLSLSDWIAWRLCGERCSEPSQAGESLCLELERPEWAWDLIDSLELPRRLFPELRTSGSPLGKLSDAAAADLGLLPGTPVAVGGADTQCGLLGAGVVRPGQLGIVGGSSAPVLQLVDHAVLDADAHLWSVQHLLPGCWAVESNAGGVGEALAWIAGLLHPEVEHPVLHLLHEAASAPPGSAGLLSTLGAEVMDARQLSLPIGNLTLNYMTSAGDPARRRHLERAIVEGMACSLRANAEQVEAVTGQRAERIRFCGGLSRSPFFTQLVSDVSGRPVETTSESEASALGAAICAGVGVGVFASLAEGADALSRVQREQLPEAEAQRCYAQLYPGWNEVRVARRESNTRASTFALGALAGALSAEAEPSEQTRPHILVSAEMTEEGLEALRRIGDVDYQSFRQAMRLLTGPALVEALRGVQIFVTEVDVVDGAALAKARDLKVIGVCRGDVVNVDVEACTALGIPVFNTPGRNADAVADLTLAFLLMLARKLAPANAFLREPGGEAGDMGRMGRAFGALQGRELWHKTVGLVGLGAVGHGVLRRLRPFGARCLVHDPYLDPDAVRLAGGEPVSLDELLAASDFVTLHAAVTESSRGLIGAEQLARMRPGSFLVNTARAALVDEEALLAALRSGHLAGAALDVFAVEPPASDHPLLALDNVLATPHVGGNTVDVAAHQGRIVAEELERLRRGKSPRHLLNPSALDGFSWSEPRKEPSAELVERLGRGPAPAVTDLQKKRETPQPAARASAPVATGGAMQEIRAKMERLLRDFVERLRGDAKLGEFAKTGQDVVLHFTLTDLDLDFHLGFGGGQVIGELGAPAQPAPVELKMKADLLDGMLTGRLNAMQAAMNGELSFSGDTAKAMTLTQIQGDMNRIYAAAREACGDPGDLTQLGVSEAAPAPAPAAAGDDIRHELCGIVDELYAAQLITATGGNVSVRIPDDPEHAWITPSQLFKGDLRPEILVRVGMDGRAADPGGRSPSSEALMHTAVLQAKPEAQAVIHCHAAHATVLVNAGLPFLPISTEAAFFQNIGRIPFVMPGTKDLADAVVEAMGDGWAVLMQNHGLLVAGRSLRRAADMAEIIERTAEVIIGCYAVGKEPPVLPEATVKQLAQFGDLMA